MQALTTETAPRYSDWNIHGEMTLIVDNDEYDTHSAALFPWIEQEQNDVCDLSRVLQHEKLE